MNIKKIQLVGYRNYESLSLEFQKNMNLFYGDNAQGKTNILESIYLCGTGKSHRTNTEKELIHFGHEFAKITVEIEKQYSTDEITFVLHQKEKKKIWINGLPITKMGELMGHIHTVMFSPEDLGLIKKGPQDRRKFMDIELCQLHPRYFYDLSQYNKALKQRNELLKKANYDETIHEIIDLWDEQIVLLGERIIQRRESFIARLKEITYEIHYAISGGKEEFQVYYEPNVLPQAYRDKLKEARKKDMIRGYTSVGPHRDDLSFMIGELDLRVYGSQGQQRSGALSLKLAELQLVREEIGEYPILLLDDVMSELDSKRQNDLLQHVEGVQTIVTGTGIDTFELTKLSEVSLFYVENGKVTIK